MIETELRSTYLLGHTDDELLRLERQAAFFAEETEETLRRAGLAPGMRVLDLGCGVGDVAVAAATIVGPDGAVLGLDRSRDAVTVANRRLTAYGLDWARCEEGDVLDRDGAGFDAVVGRFILMHLVDPVALLDQFRRGLGAGGILAFIEMDIDSAAITPSMPLFERCVAAIISVYQRAGSEPNMGARLFATFRHAGLSPVLRGSCRVEGGVDAPVYDYLAGTMRSLWPSMVAEGVAPEGVRMDTLAAALRQEAAMRDFSVAYPRLTGAWARV